MEKQINISVAIAVYNKEDSILSTLNSVFNQTYPVSEIILVNDGSTDTSEAVILSIKDSRIKYFSQENQGASSARNKAISHCSYEYIALLDADDLWQSTYLEEIVKLIENYTEQRVFSTAIEIENKRNKVNPARYSILKHQKTGVYNYFEASLLQSLLHSSSTVLHKSVFEKVGLFDTKIKSGEDTDMWVRIGLEYPIVFTNKALVRYTNAPTGLYQTKVPIKNRFSFVKFKKQEKNNIALKKFLDLNRFSLAIYASKAGDTENYNLLKSSITKQNLSIKKRIILELPAWLIKILDKI